MLKTAKKTSRTPNISKLYRITSREVNIPHERGKIDIIMQSSTHIEELGIEFSKLLFPLHQNFKEISYIIPKAVKITIEVESNNKMDIQIEIRA